MVPETTKSRDDIILENQNLIWNVIYAHYNNVPIDKEDLYQTGMIALIRAVDSYDPAKGELSTVAVTSIKREIKRYIIQNKAIQIPEYLNLNIMQIASEVQEIEKKGEKVTPKKIAERCDISVSDAKKYLEIYQHSSDPVSLDAECEEGGTLLDTLASNDVEGVHNNIYLQEIMSAIEEIYGKKYADIIKAYYIQNLTLEEVGNRFGITRERVRQIINKIDCSEETNVAKDKTNLILLRKKLGS